MKVITLDGLKAFLDALLEKIGDDVYTKTQTLDAKFLKKTDKIDAYTKSEADGRFGWRRSCRKG